MTLVHAFDLQHGFWVVLATLTVVRTTATATSVTAARDAVLGTAIGFAISTVMILGVASDSHLYGALLGRRRLRRRSTRRGRAACWPGRPAFTVLVVVLFSLLAPSNWTLALVRVEDVMAGALVGVAIGLLAWPRGRRRAAAGGDRRGDRPRRADEAARRRAPGARPRGRRGSGRPSRRDPLVRAPGGGRPRRRPGRAPRRGPTRPTSSGRPCSPAPGRSGTRSSWLSEVPASPAAAGALRVRSPTTARRARSDAAAAGYRAVAAALREGGAQPPAPGVPPRRRRLVEGVRRRSAAAPRRPRGARAAAGRAALGARARGRRSRPGSSHRASSGSGRVAERPEGRAARLAQPRGELGR